MPYVGEVKIFLKSNLIGLAFFKNPNYEYYCQVFHNYFFDKMLKEIFSRLLTCKVVCMVTFTF